MLKANSAIRTRNNFMSNQSSSQGIGNSIERKTTQGATNNSSKNNSTAKKKKIIKYCSNSNSRNNMKHS